MRLDKPKKQTKKPGGEDMYRQECSEQ